MITKRINRVHSVQEMHDLAGRAIEGVAPGSLFLLFGELGAGKTAFTQGVALALGIQELPTSPTFTIVSEYAVPNHPVIRVLVHLDLYRLSAHEAHTDPMVQEAISQATNPERLTIVEWADRLGDKLPDRVWKLIFMPGVNEGERIVDIVQSVIAP